jgi:hypothetical protein
MDGTGTKLTESMWSQPTISNGRFLQNRVSLLGRVLPIAALRGSSCVCPLHEAARGHEGTFDASAQIVANRGGVRLQFCSPAPPPLQWLFAIRAARSVSSRVT